jgi:hypothetical protein
MAYSYSCKHQGTICALAWFIEFLDVDRKTPSSMNGGAR